MFGFLYVRRRKVFRAILLRCIYFANARLSILDKTPKKVFSKMFEKTAPFGKKMQFLSFFKICPKLNTLYVDKPENVSPNEITFD